MTHEEVKLLVERLKAECFCGLCPTCEAASALTLLAQEREELREALEPFADAVIGEFINDDDITADDFRLARSVRDKLKGGE